MGTWTQLGSRSRRAVQLATGEGSPTTETDIGIDLSRVDRLLPVFRAPGGQTFTGTGVVRGWIYVAALGVWVRAPRIDDDFAEAAGLALVVLPAIPCFATGRFLYVPETVGLSGGTDLTTDYYCHNKEGEAI